MLRGLSSTVGGDGKWVPSANTECGASPRSTLHGLLSESQHRLRPFGGAWQAASNVPLGFH